MNTTQSVWQLISVIVFVTAISLFTACNGLPIAAPEEIRTDAQVTVTPQVTSTTVTPVSGAENSAFSSPVSADTVRQTTSTPEITQKPQVATPTSSPTLSPITDFTSVNTSSVTNTVQSDMYVGGYIFGTPELIPNTYGHSVQILNQLSEKTDEIIILRDTNLETLNVETGKTHRFRENVTSNEIYGKPVWIPDEEALAIVTDPMNSGNYELVFTYADDKVPSRLIATGISSGISQSIDKQSLLSLTQGENLKEINTLTLQGQETTLPLTEDITSNRTKFFQVATNPVTSWLAYYNPEDLFLVNPETNEVRVLDLGRHGEDPLWTMKAEWSPNGKQLALLTSAGTPPLAFSNLQIYDFESEEIKVLQDSFQIINDFTWAPDNRQLIISAVVGKKEYKLSETENFESNASALFLIDTLTEEILPLPILPEDVASSGTGLLWTSDGKSLIAWYREYEGKIGLYKVDASQP